MQTRLENITISTFYYVLVSTKVTAVWSAMASCSSVPQFLLHFHSILLTTGAEALQLEHEVLLKGGCVRWRVNSSTLQEHQLSEQFLEM